MWPVSGMRLPITGTQRKSKQKAASYRSDMERTQSGALRTVAATEVSSQSIQEQAHKRHFLQRAYGHPPEILTGSAPNCLLLSISTAPLTCV